MVSESNSKQRGRTIKQKMAILFVLIAAGLWGSVGIFVRTLTGYGLNSMQITTGKAVYGLITVLLYLLIKNRKLLSIHIKDLGWFAANGILGIFFFNYCYITTLQLSGMAVAAILLYTSPIFVILLSIVIFKEKLTLIKCSSLVLAFIGCVLVSGIGTQSASISMVALLLGLCAGFGYALYSIFSRILVKKYHSLTAVLYTFIFTVLAALCFTDIHGIFEVYRVYPNAIGVHLFAGICTNAVPYILYTFALMNLEASKASMLASVEPVVAALLGFLIFQETLSITAIIGIACIMMMIFLLSKDGK